MYSWNVSYPNRKKTKILCKPWGDLRHTLATPSLPKRGYFRVALFLFLIYSWMGLSSFFAIWIFMRAKEKKDCFCVARCREIERKKDCSVEKSLFPYFSLWLFVVVAMCQQLERMDGRVQYVSWLAGLLPWNGPLSYGPYCTLTLKNRVLFLSFPLSLLEALIQSLPLFGLVILLVT